MKELSTKDMYYRKAKPISYSIKERDKAKDVKYIVIHYTAGEKDAAKNNVDYFAPGNIAYAGAHFFVDQEGKIGRSIPMNHSANAVGGKRLSLLGGTLYGKVTNENSVSIELCSLLKKEPSDEMVEAVKDLIKYIQKYCPKATTIVRHYDVTSKSCPASMVDYEKWENFLTRIGYTLVGKKV